VIPPSAVASRISVARPFASIRAGARDPVFLVALLVSSAFVLLFVLYPLFRILSQGFFTDRGVFDLGAYARVLTRPVYQTVIANTLKLGISAAIISTAIGFLFAYTLVRVDSRSLRPLRLLAMMPLVSPPFAVAMSTILLFGRSGLITKGLFGIEYNIYGFVGLLLVQAVTFFPVAMLIFEGMLRQLDASLEEAAEGMGASKWRIFRTVTIPLMMPGILGSLLVIFIESLADLGNPIIIGGDYNVLSAQSWLVIIGQSDFQLGAAMSVVLLVPSLIAFIVQRYYLSRASYIAVGGKPSGGRIRLGGGGIRTSLLACCWLIASFILLVYVMIFIGAVTFVWGADFKLTFEHYLSAIDRGQKAILDTTILSAIATPITGLLGVVIAFLVVRKKFAWRETLDFTSMLGAAVPGTVLGIGFILAFNREPLLLTGTAEIIVLCFVVRSLATGLRAAVAGLQQIDPSIEEASTNLGAGTATTFRRVTLPLISGALLAGMIFSFSRNMTALSAIIFLVSPRTKIMTREILNLVEVGYLGPAIALITILIVIVLVAMGIMYWLVGRTGRSKDVLGLEAGH
jgi:iron(III) transport system permease protein